MKRLILILLSLLFTFWANAQLTESAKQVVEKSIQYHDPNAKLSKHSWTMKYEDLSHFKFNPLKGDFEVKRIIKEKDVVLNISNGNFKATVNGSSQFSNIEMDEKYTSKERGLMMRNYYHYLWSLPMKLNDPGTIIHENVQLTDFFGKKTLQVKVTYAPEVGKDIWYFYFDPTNFSLQGYRFYHNEEDNDGEYILLEDELESNGVRIPKTRKWYTHKEARFLGMDRIVMLEFD